MDGQTWHDYEANLEANLRSLLERAKSGSYQAPPVRRVYIPKGGSPTEKRPIGIPTIEDKVLQRAVLMLLEPIYERDFYDCSYRFPSRTVGPRRVGRILAAGDERSGPMGLGGGYPQVF